jgi:succinate-semialdehyde dehydrogenase/glutarate-semialdehyde dehydrogenase
MTEEELLGSVPRGLFIDGGWREASTGATLAVEDPATGKVLAEVADASVEDGTAALDAAVRAQPAWRPPRRASGRSCCGRRTSGSSRGRTSWRC